MIKTKPSNRKKMNNRLLLNKWFWLLLFGQILY